MLDCENISNNDIGEKSKAVTPEKRINSGRVWSQSRDGTKLFLQLNEGLKMVTIEASTGNVLSDRVFGNAEWAWFLKE